MSAVASSKSKSLHRKVRLAIGKSTNNKDNVETLGSRKKGFQGYKKAQITVEDGVDVSYKDGKLIKRENNGRRNTKLEAKDKQLHTGQEGYGAKGDGNSGFKQLNSDRKRKRIYADQGNGKEGMFKKNVEKSNRKAPSREGWNGPKDDPGREKRTAKWKSRDFEQSNKRHLNARANELPDSDGGKKFRAKVKAINRGGWNEPKDDPGREKRTVKGKSRDFEQSNKRHLNVHGNEFPDSDGGKKFRAKVKDTNREGWNEPKDDPGREKRTAKGKSRDFEQSNKRHLNARANEFPDSDGGMKFRAKVKATNKVESDKTGVAWNSLLKKDAKSQLGRNPNMLIDESLKKFAKKKVHDKKRLDDESAVTYDWPKRKKRVIRIDPHDTSNKRLDDGIITNENTKQKKEDLKKNESGEMSMNAQFRAIQPTPSILSFVEENLLGRRRLIDLRRAGYNIDLSAPLDNVPFSTSSERERIEEAIFRNKLSFFAAAKISSSLPPPDLPEIAFAGRSNVGKSSLLNALTRQWGVVRTSDKPGLTQTINFFNLGPKFCLVDLPGYGFAYAKEEVKEAWEELVKEYVSTRVGLKQVCLLIDTKWGMKPRDYELIDLMERSKTKYQILLTKTDLVFPIEVARRAMQIEESLKTKKSAIPPVMMVSSKSGAGVRSLRTVLAKIARFAKL